METHKKPSRQDVLNQLARILDSSGFKDSARGSQFLSYVVHKTLDDGEGQIKGYTIGVEVFGKPDDFNPDTDAAVRVEAARIRKTLSLYYHEEGKHDPVLIEIPKGAYSPKFSFNQTPTQTKPVQASNNTKQLMTTLAVILCLAVLVFVYSKITKESKPAAVQDVTYQWFRPDVVVLPFHYIGGNGADMIAENFRREIINDIGRFKEVEVVAIDIASDPDEERDRADQRSAANYQIEGMVRQTEGDSYRIILKLMELQNTTYIWSYDEIHRADRGGHINKLAGEIVSSLISPYGVIQAHELQRVTNLDDWSLSPYKCTLGYYIYANNKNEESHAKIRDCLEKTLEDIPEYSSAWGWLSWMYGDEYRYGFNPRGDKSDIIKRAVDAAQKAVLEDPDNARAHAFVAVAARLIGDDELVRHHIKISLLLNPYDAEILANAAWRYAEIGEWESGKALAEQALSMTQGTARWYYGILFSYYFNKGDFENALVNALEYYQPGALNSYLALAASYQALGHDDKARETIDLMSENFPYDSYDTEKFLREWPFEPDFTRKLLAAVKAAGLKFESD